MKQYFSSWTFMRYLRLVMALYLGYETVVTEQWILSVFPVFLFVQAVFGIGCCSCSQCDINGSKSSSC